MSLHDTPAEAATLRCLVYRSRARVSRRIFENSSAVEDFAARNRKLDLGGYLHFEDGCFYQVIEGSHDKLDLVWKSIQRDARHEAITLLSDTHIAQRHFAQWAMGYNSEDEHSLFDFAARSSLSLRGPSSVQIVMDFLRAISGSQPQLG